MRYPILAFVLCGGVSITSQIAAQTQGRSRGPEPSSQQEPTTEVYDIADLITATANIEYDNETWPGMGILSGDARGLNNSGETIMGGNMGGQSMGGYGGMSGGMGMGGGGMGGAGMGMGGVGEGGMGGYGDGGGMGMGGEGEGGMGGYGSGGRMGMGSGGMGGYGGRQAGGPISIETGSLGNGRGLKAFNGERRKTIVSLLLTIEPSTWGKSSKGGTIRVFENLLIVEQSPSVHKKVAEYLDIIRKKTRVNDAMVIEWCVLSKDPKLAGEQELSEDQIGQAVVVRGSVNCLNRQTVATSTGTHVNYVTGVTPVVGGGSEGSAYSPMTVKPLQGWIIETQASLIDTGNGSLEAIVDVAATHTAAIVDSQAPAAIKEGEIDRIALESLTLVGSTRMPAGRWTLAASFQPDAGNTELTEARWLVVRWKEGAGE